jgi:hypothetical protein
MGLVKLAARVSIFALATASFALADSVSLGVFSFDQIIAPDSTQNIAGVNSFDITAFTGTGALPFDFPVTSEITLTNVVLTLNGVQPDVISLSNIDENNSGFFAVSSTASFTTAEITATLNGSTQPIVVTLSDGSTVTLNPNVDIFLIPSTGTLLSAGTDTAVISATQQVPEPSSWYFLGLTVVGLLGLFAWERRCSPMMQ